jgi:SAM-dependent methyltransferase
MSHSQQRRFLATVAEFFPEFFVGSRVLEIGSLDVNGSARSFFTNCDYTGLDVAPGIGVDVVCGGHEYDAADGTFDIVLSMETMEHNPYWVDTVRNMLRLCRTGGTVLVSCASLGRPEHGTTRSDPGSSPLTVGLGWDHYRNLSEAELRRTVVSARHQVLVRYWTNWQTHDLYMAAVKGTPNAEVTERFASMSSVIETDVRRENQALRARVKRIVLGRRHGETVVTSVRRLRRMCRGA